MVINLSSLGYRLEIGEVGFDSLHRQRFLYLHSGCSVRETLQHLLSQCYRRLMVNQVGTWIWTPTSILKVKNMWLCNFTPMYLPSKAFTQAQRQFRFLRRFGQTGFLLGSLNHSKDTTIGYDGTRPLIVPRTRQQVALILLELLLWILFCTKLTSNPSGMWQCAVVWMAPDVSKDQSTNFNFLVYPRKQGQYDLSKRREPFTQRHSVTSQKTWAFTKDAMRNFNFWSSLKFATFLLLLLLLLFSC